MRIVAVAVTPSPLPASVGRIVLPPISRVHLGVSVSNTAFVRQPVSLTVTLTALTGSSSAAQTQTMTVTLGALRSFAFVPRLLETTPGEHAAPHPHPGRRGGADPAPLLPGRALRPGAAKRAKGCRPAGLVWERSLG